jgi:hypothetical protein
MDSETEIDLILKKNEEYNRSLKTHDENLERIMGKYRLGFDKSGTVKRLKKGERHKEKFPKKNKNSKKSKAKKMN